MAMLLKIFLLRLQLNKRISRALRGGGDITSTSMIVPEHPWCYRQQEFWTPLAW